MTNEKKLEGLKVMNGNNAEMVIESVDVNKPYSHEPYEVRVDLAFIDYEVGEMEKEFFENFNRNNYQNDRSRNENSYGTDKELMNRKRIKKIWDAFKEEEMIDFLSSNGEISVKKLVEIGIDKFIYAMGFRKPKSIGDWKNHIVRMGICTHCQDEFVPLMIQQNGGVCRKCMKLYSFDALRLFVEEQMKIPRDAESALVGKDNILMNVMVLFVNDQNFREMFLVGTPFVESILEKNKEGDEE